MELNKTVQVLPGRTLNGIVSGLKTDQPEFFQMRPWRVTPELIGGYRVGVLQISADLKTREVMEMILEKKLFPASVWHLLAFAEQYPDSGPGRSRLMALGTMFMDMDMEYHAPCLLGRSGQYTVSTAQCTRWHWVPGDKFLVIDPTKIKV